MITRIKFHSDLNDLEACVDIDCRTMTAHIDTPRGSTHAEVYRDGMLQMYDSRVLSVIDWEILMDRVATVLRSHRI